MTNTEKKKNITKYIVDHVNMIDISGKSGMYYQDLLDKMTLEQFDDFMHKLKEKQCHLFVTMPNLQSKYDVKKMLKCADDIGANIYSKIWLTDPTTGKSYLTNQKYLIFQMPVRRLQQILDKKLSVPTNDRVIDGLTGQVTGDDRSLRFSSQETQIMHAKGLDKTLTELMKVRGGDISAYGEFKQQLEETGIATMYTITPGTRPRSAKIANILLKGMMLDNNL